MRHLFVLSHRRFGTTYSSIFKGQAVQEESLTSRPLKMEPVGCPETSATKCESALHNIPEQRRSHLQRGGNLKS